MRGYFEQKCFLLLQFSFVILGIRISAQKQKKNINEINYRGAAKCWNSLMLKFSFWCH